jgi:hypothetical protein
MGSIFISIQSLPILAGPYLVHQSNDNVEFVFQLKNHQISLVSLLAKFLRRYFINLGFYWYGFNLFNKSERV